MIDDSRRRVSQVGKDLIPYFLELFGCKFQFGLIKIQIICRINRNQMHVCMRYFKPNNFNTQRLHLKDLSMALAIGFANTSISARYSSERSKNLSVSVLGTTKTCPSRKGKMSRKAKNFSFSAIL